MRVVFERILEGFQGFSCRFYRRILVTFGVLSGLQEDSRCS